MSPDRFPEFSQDKHRVLLFSRGRGRGHAIPDIEILKALEEQQAGVEVRIVSYGLGADTFTSLGYPVIDLRMPDESPTAEITVLAGRLTGWLRPDLVVAHEEFAAMPAAKIFDRSTIFITDFFTSAESWSMHALRFADRILFLGTESPFDIPSWLEEKVQFVGRVLRQFRYRPADRAKAREELGIAEDAFVIFVSQGNWPERDAPLAGILNESIDRLPAAGKAVIWIAGTDKDLVGSKLNRCQVLVFDRYWEVDRIMAAADLAITKSNRVTVFELHHFGLPSLALMWGLNPYDEIAIRGLESVQPVAARHLTPERLASLIQSAAMQTRRPQPDSDAARVCAAVILDALTRAGR